MSRVCSRTSQGAVKATVNIFNNLELVDWITEKLFEHKSIIKENNREKV